MALTWAEVLDLQDSSITRVPQAETAGSISFTTDTHCEAGDIAIPVPGEVGDSPAKTMTWLMEALIKRQDADETPPSVVRRNISVINGVPTVTYTFSTAVESLDAFPPNATADDLFTSLE